MDIFLFRNKPESFKYDAFARDLCKQGMKEGMDEKIMFDFHPNGYQFFMMPLMHSENLEDHELSRGNFEEKFKRLDKEHPSYQSLLKYKESGETHADIIKTCGRYPQRNHILGRKTTDQEIEIIKKHNLMALIDHDKR